MTFGKLTASSAMMLAAALASAQTHVSPDSAYIADGYHLVWHDEFDTPDGSNPSPDYYETPSRGNSAWARFISDRPDLMVINDGVLQMYCKPNPEPTGADDRAMVSGAIQTRGKVAFRHGRAEARIRVHGHKGSFPAFWLMPDGQPKDWPMSGEIDIFESINDEDVAYATLHTGKAPNDDVITPGYKEPVDISEWHVYGVEWDGDTMRFFIDGEQKGEVTRATAGQGLWPFDESQFYIILNQSAGMGTWAADADTSHTYLTEVDWVRLYQRPGQENTLPAD